MFLRLTEHTDKVSEPRSKGWPRKPVEAVPVTFLEGIAGGQVEEIEGDEVFLMDATDEPSGGGAAAPAAMDVERLAAAAPAASRSCAPAARGEPQTKRSRRAGVAALVEKVLDDYEHPGLEETAQEVT